MQWSVLKLWTVGGQDQCSKAQATHDSAHSARDSVGKFRNGCVVLALLLPLPLSSFVTSIGHSNLLFLGLGFLTLPSRRVVTDPF